MRTYKCTSDFSSLCNLYICILIIILNYLCINKGIADYYDKITAIMAAPTMQDTMVTPAQIRACLKKSIADSGSSFATFSATIMLAA